MGEAGTLAAIGVRSRIGLVLVVIAVFVSVVAAAGARSVAAPKGDVVAGKRLFKGYCGLCHTLKAAGTVAKAKSRAVSFDRRRERFARVFQVLVEGEGEMLPFTDRLTFKQLKDVAAFVDGSTRRNPAVGY